MQLLLSITRSTVPIPPDQTSQVFDHVGGTLGRDEHCEWVIPDPTQHVSNLHARIQYRDGAYYFIDESSNGTTLVNTGQRLAPGHPLQLTHGMELALADTHVTALLIKAAQPAEPALAASMPLAAEVPPGKDLDVALANLLAPAPSAKRSAEAPPAFVAQDDHVPVARQNMPAVKLVPETPAEAEPVAAVSALDAAFWQAFADGLGVNLDALDAQQRQALAVNAAGLLRDCVGGLQQTLRACSALKNELRLDVAEAPLTPLERCAGAREALQHLLLDAPESSAPNTAHPALARAVRSVQAHQSAMLGACRGAVREAFNELTPAQLILRFERNAEASGWSSSRWRAYCRYHAALEVGGDWPSTTLARHFAPAYHEHLRLLDTVHAAYPG